MQIQLVAGAGFVPDSEHWPVIVTRWTYSPAGHGTYQDGVSWSLMLNLGGRKRSLRLGSSA